MKISVILVSYNTAEMSVEALTCLFASVGPIELEVFVVDNASKDNSVQRIGRSFPQIKMIVNEKNVGFGRANNQVLNQVTGEYVLLLNTDAFIEPDTITKTVNYMQKNAKIGVLGVRLVGSDGSQQPSCRHFPKPFNSFVQRLGLEKLFPAVTLVDETNWNPQLSQTCDWVPGCYYLVRRAVIDDVGLFDNRYFLYSEEVDHCFATKKAGWLVGYFADATVVHIGGESAKTQGNVLNQAKQLSTLQAESELIYFRKNHGVFNCILHILLTFIEDIVIFIKDMAKLRIFKTSYFFSASKVLFASAIKTNFGKTPVR